ncbi:hypothetical protein Tsubulata_025763 [Turnera subulata]|uniref:F-box domain-containing protein n=1 Tax=Turnera subulata TaxID=218843 RepID=A0A9Q0GBF1_9ROSI|nr:hypothetical protein Tsubulata_025763 [Turnera subulata]
MMEEKKKNKKYRSKRFRRVNNLPIEIIANILSRLPIKNVVGCKIVCKSWRHLITSDPYFAKLHLSMPPQQCLLLHPSPIPRPDDPRSRRLYKQNMIDLSSTTSTTTTTTGASSSSVAMTIEVGPKLDTREKFKGDIVGSCNGLICSAQDCEEELDIDASGGGNKLGPRLWFRVCNPITGEYIVIESSVRRPKYDLYGYPRMEFCYCPSSDQYKIMVQRESGLMIHTLGSNLWRGVQDIPNQQSASKAASLNGALHWVFSVTHRGVCVVALDIENEAVRFVIPAPPKIRGDHNVHASQLNVSVSRGWLTLFPCRITQFERDEGNGVDIWVMKEYGEVSSWTKQHVVLSSSLVGRSPHLYRLIPIHINTTTKAAAALREGGGEGGDVKILALSQRRGGERGVPSILLSVDVGTNINTAKEVEVDVKPCSLVIPYTPSLLSLGDVFAGKGFTILKFESK